MHLEWAKWGQAWLHLPPAVVLPQGHLEQFLSRWHAATPVVSCGRRENHTIGARLKLGVCDSRTEELAAW